MFCGYSIEDLTDLSHEIDFLEDNILEEILNGSKLFLREIINIFKFGVINQTLNTDIIFKV